MKNRVISLRESRRAKRLQSENPRRFSLHDPRYCAQAREAILDIDRNGRTSSYRRGDPVFVILPSLPRISPWRKAPAIDSLPTYPL